MAEGAPGTECTEWFLIKTHRIYHRLEGRKEEWRWDGDEGDPGGRRRLQGCSATLPCL